MFAGGDMSRRQSGTMDPRRSGKRLGEQLVGLTVKKPKSMPANAVGAAQRMSFSDDTCRLDGKVNVQTFDGKLLELPHEVTASSPKLQVLLAQSEDATHGHQAVPLDHVDCTSANLHRAIQYARLGTSMDDLVWPSSAAWSFLRCTAFLGTPVLMDITAQGAANVLVDCILDTNEQSLGAMFGQSPPQGLADTLLQETVDSHNLDAIQTFIRSSKGLGVRAGRAAAAALANVESSPLANTGPGMILRWLRATDELFLLCTEELFSIFPMQTRESHAQECKTEGVADIGLPNQCTEEKMGDDRQEEIIATSLSAVTDSRFAGVAAVVEAASKALMTARGSALLDQVLTTLEVVVQPNSEVVTDAISAWLRSERGRNWVARERAVALLARAAPPGSHAAAEALSARLLADEEHWALHEAAIAALSTVAPHGNSSAVSALSARLTDVDEAARLASLDALKRIAPRGDQTAIAALSVCVLDSKDSVREGAASALIKVAERCNGKARDLALECIRSNQESRRISGIEILTAVAAVDDQVSTSELLGLFTDPVLSVRDAAIAAISRVVSRGNAVACAAAHKLLCHKSWQVRARGAVLLGSISLVGDTGVAKAIGACLEDIHTGVRIAVTEALAQLSDNEKGNQAILEVIYGRLTHAKWAVRQAAVGALVQNAHFEDPQALQAIIAKLTDDAAGVRDQALTALAQLAPRGHQRVMTTITALASHRDPTIRATAMKAFGKLATRGDCTSISVTSGMVDDANPVVRQQALQALAQLTGQSDDMVAVVKIAAQKLEDTAESVRQAASALIVSTAETAGGLTAAAALEEVRSKCEHRSQIVRRIATSTTSRLEAIMGPELVKVKQEAAISKTEDIADGELEVSRTFEEPADCEQQCKRSQSLGPDGVSLGLRAFLTELRAMNLGGDPIEPEDKVKLGLQMFLAEQRRRPGPVSALNVSPKSRVRLLPPVRVFRPEHQIDDVQTCKHEEFQEVLECDPDTQLSVNHCHTDAGSNGLEARDDELDSLSSTSEGSQPLSSVRSRSHGSCSGQARESENEGSQDHHSLRMDCTGLPSGHTATEADVCSQRGVSECPDQECHYDAVSTDPYDAGYSDSIAVAGDSLVTQASVEAQHVEGVYFVDIELSDTDEP